jgi:PHS family inorganic phosphate transporter-like MFS transporter
MFQKHWRLLLTFTSAQIFALNTVIPILAVVYGEEITARGYLTAMAISTLAGTMIGQVLFGILADMFGRKKMYGWELIVAIIATLGLAISADGKGGSMKIIGLLIFWRTMMGIGIGADYPLSAVITSE